jgi:hypothetical protein
MDYKEFYKSELFPDKDIPITDEYLIEHGWHKVTSLLDPEQKWCYFDSGILGRMYVDRCGKKPLYRLYINHVSGTRFVNTITDIKVAIYSYTCGLQAVKYGFDAKAGGYKWIDVDTKEEEDEYRYNKYKSLVKAIEQ